MYQSKLEKKIYSIYCNKKNKQCVLPIIMYQHISIINSYNFILFILRKKYNLKKNITYIDL